MAESQRPDVAAVLSRLKPFQRATVDHVFRCLYEEPGGSNRFLVSDEVGLGKTMVAKGVIAKAIDHLWPKLADIGRIDIVYISSNSQIARQNINRLNVVGDDAAVEASRITMLPTQLKGLQDRSVNFVAFTPGSSFDLRSSMGWWWERVVLYWMLREAWGFGTSAGPKNLLQGGVSFESRDWFRGRLASFRDHQDIDPTLLQRFQEALADRVRFEKEQKRPTIKRRFNDLCDHFAYVHKHKSKQSARDQAQIIGELRSILAETCIRALEPDLVILDEFQRFKHLLSEEDEGGRLAKELLDYSDEHTDVRVLLLSATPYKMYTLHTETATENHYADFLHTLRFLMKDSGRAGRVSELLEEYRREVYRVAAVGPERLLEIRADIEYELSRVMVRSERLTSTTDGSGMVRHVTTSLPELTVRELCCYPPLERLGGILDAGGMLEYWKSSPYLLNFMQDYKVKRQLKKRLTSDGSDPQLIGAVRAAQRAMLSWEEIERYGEVDPGNVRLRALMDDTLDRGWWRLLWIPAAMPYYRARGPYAGFDGAAVTKRLVFSGWAVVPRTIAAVVSYEAERRRFTSFERNPVNTAEARKRRAPLLQFTFSEGRYTGFPIFCLIYPSIELARAGNVRGIAWVHGTNGLPDLDAILDTVQAKIAPGLESLIRKYGSVDGPVDERWLWAAPMLLDLARHRSQAEAWLAQEDLADLWANPGLGDGDDQPGARWVEHVDEAKKLIFRPEGLGRPPDDLLRLLAEVALASPAVCALRSLARVTGTLALTSNVGVRNAAAQVGWGFRTLFNRLSATALVRSLYEESGDPYWRMVLRYCADGVLQAVLDEYSHVLRDSHGVQDHPPGDAAVEIAKEITDALMMRTASIVVDEVRASSKQVTIQSRRMRMGYAMAFGKLRDEREGDSVRPESLRVAFNSPFRPFVLATTSIGQEGLDFHQYCHAVVHWNLPANPVDLEQREGRVHRYKCHAVRKNLAAKYGMRVSGLDATDPWEAIFQLASSEVPEVHGGMVPFWVYDPPGGCAIERHVPALPLSKDEQRYEDLRRSLAVYRMVFGQPRQEDLVAYLIERVSPERLNEIRGHLQICLAPRANGS